ncbi:MAG: glycosyltransferase family 2 protein [Brachybacterium sp.]|nr:glycosyltransferase family 2 protein [Brachybacterium sp.]
MTARSTTGTGESPTEGHAPGRTIAERPTCSVVVPVLNDATELSGLLAALDRQTEPPLEVVVVDNGSSDESAALAREAGCRVLSEPRPGIAAAASTGYDAARGDLILRCDADTRPEPSWVAAHRLAHRRATSRRPGRRRVVAVTGPGMFDLPPPLGTLTSVAYHGAYTLASAAALGHPPLFGTTSSFRRDWWLEVRGCASRSSAVHDDMDLSFCVRPTETVLLSRAVTVGMSPRALRPGSGMRQRFLRAGRTLVRAWRRQLPWFRWWHRGTARAHLLRGVRGGR